MFKVRGKAEVPPAHRRGRGLETGLISGLISRKVSDHPLCLGCRWSRRVGAGVPLANPRGLGGPGNMGSFPHPHTGVSLIP